MIRSLFFVAVGLFAMVGVYVLNATPASPPGSFIPEALSLATGIKARVTEHYASEGRFPESNAALEMALAATFATDQIGSLWVSRGGVINVRARHSADVIRLIPAAADDAMQVTWRCASPNMPAIASLVPACRHEPDTPA
jgi:hypothetical protein